MQAYDDGNLFNKIIKGDIPCHKIFETDHALAILDAFPLAPGHALLLPKAKCVSVLDMPAEVRQNRQDSGLFDCVVWAAMRKRCVFCG